MKNLIFLCLFFTYTCFSSQIISGKVYDQENKYLEGVTIGIIGENMGGISNETGEYFININNIDKGKTLIAYFPGFETFKIKIEDFLNLSNQNIVLKEKIVDIKEVVITPNKIIKKNLGVRTKSNKKYCGYNSKNNKELYNEYAIKIKNKKHIKIEKINLNLSFYKIESPIKLVFDIYDGKKEFPEESIVTDYLSKDINSNADIYNNIVSLDISDKNIWVDDDFFVSVRAVNDFKGYLYLSGNIYAFSQDTFHRLYFDKWKKFSSGAPSINVDVKIKK